MIMSPANNKPAAGKDDRRTPSSAAAAAAARPPQEPALKCPRCDSPNTKFCYYNNYSLAQPRHFCKTCRRYWTRGGALRNVPIGGGCRKNKKSSKSSSSPRLSSGGDSMDNSGGSARDGNGGLKFFQGISPAMDFQLGGTASAAAMMINFPAAPLFNQFSHFGDLSNTCGAISSTPCFTAFDPSATTSSPPLMGFNFPFSSPLIKQGENNFQSNLASSIESLSSINQDLHWKLQQQRLSMMFVGDDHHHQRESNAAVAPPPSNIGTLNLAQKPQPILFQNLDVSKADESCGAGSTQRRDHCGGGGGNQNLSTEWFFDNSSYAAVTPTPASSGSNVNDQNNSGNWSNIQAWSDLNQYASLP